MGFDPITAIWSANEAADRLNRSGDSGGTSYIKRTETPLIAGGLNGMVPAFYAGFFDLGGLASQIKEHGRYKVYVDGRIYEGELKTITLSSGGEVGRLAYFGNLSLFVPEETDTGENYLFIHILDSDLTALFDTKCVDGEAYAFGLWEITETIDPKYLPGVCLPVVELTSTVLDEGTVLSAEECAALDTARGWPAIIKYNNSAILVMYINADAKEMFIDTSGMLSGFGFIKNGEAWIMAQI